MKHRIITIFFSVFSSIYAWGDAVGTWKVYPSYSDITEIAPAGKKVFVLASNSLYSYNVSDGSLQTYTKNDCLNSSNIKTIAWVNAAKKLVIAYSDCTIDLLSANGEVEHISALADKQTTDDKTINSIYVSGHYAYICTGFGIMKLNVKDANVADTYNLGYKVNYCYQSSNYLYAASETKGMMRCLLTANLLNRNEWEQDGDYKSQTKDRYVYDSTNGGYWASDDNSNLTLFQKQEDGSFQPITTGVKPDGPQFNEHNYITFSNGRILSVRGRYEYVSSDTSTPGILQEYNVDADKWYSYDNSFATEHGKDCIAQTHIAVDPRDANHVMVAAKSGIYEYRDRRMVAYYDMNTDDPVMSIINNVNYSVVTGISYDTDGNLWAFNMGNEKILCLKSTGEWESLSQSGLSNTDNHRIKRPFFDSRGLMWYANDSWRASLFGFYDVKSNQMRQISKFVNQYGKTILDSKNIFCVAEDRANNIWVGGEEGCLYVTPDNISQMCKSTDLTNNDVIVTQPAVRRDDGTDFIDFVLDNMFICDIKVDKANRKWFATNNGVYLLNDDNVQSAHFTTENSSLPSNEVKSIAIDEHTGTVYFGTLEGLCSYQSDITENYGDMTDNNVYAYPNPVTADYTGDITITGLTNGSQIKILTSSGHIVNEGICSGGSYRWNGCDKSGRKVASGVYMVNVATPAGESGIVTKVAIIR